MQLLEGGMDFVVIAQSNDLASLPLYAGTVQVG